MNKMNEDKGEEKIVRKVISTVNAVCVCEPTESGIVECIVLVAVHIESHIVELNNVSHSVAYLYIHYWLGSRYLYTFLFMSKCKLPIAAHAFMSNLFEKGQAQVVRYGKLTSKRILLNFQNLQRTQPGGESAEQEKNER